MVNRERVLEALRGVQDPELGKSILELGMVRDVVVTDHEVRFALALTTLACPLRERIVDDARQAVLALDHVDDVKVTLREMTREEKERIWSPQQPGGQPSGTAADLNRIEQVAAVMSGKGGVGKSSVAALLAVALRRQGKRVAVLDADITGPSIPHLFGLRQPPAAGPLGLLPFETTTGIKVMSINLLLPDENQPVIWRGPLIGATIKQFWGDVVWGDVDVMILDLPPGTSDAALTIMQSIALNGVLLVTSPQDLAGMVVRKAANMAGLLNVPIVGLVENMSFTVCPKCGEQIKLFGGGRSEQMATQLNVPFLGRLPLDPELTARSDVGEIEMYHSDVIEAMAVQFMRDLPAVKTTPVF